MKATEKSILRSWSVLFGMLLLCLSAITVRADEGTEQAVLETEAGYIFEYPTEEGKDVFIQTGQEGAVLSEVVLTVRTDGQESQAAGETIANVAAFHLDGDAELIRMEGLMDGQPFRTELQELDEEEGIELETSAGEPETDLSSYIVDDAETNDQAVTEAMAETGQTGISLMTLDEPENRIVVIDPGHGPDSPGASRTWDGVKYREELMTYQIAEYLREELEQYPDITVYMTRDESETPTIRERVEYASEVGADILVSIHLNATDEEVTTAHGVETMVAKIGTYNPENAQEGQELGRAILDELVALGFNDRGFAFRMGDEPDDLYEDGSVSDYYGIVRYGQMLNVPSIIVEHGFLNNETDFRNFLSTDEGLRNLAAADARGILNYFGMKAKPEVEAWDETYVGDWDGDGIDTLCGRIGNMYYFKNDLSGGEADTVIAYGKVDDTVLVGDWDGDGRDSLCVRRGKFYYFKNSIAGGEADHVIAYGHETDQVFTGDWDGDGKDTLSVRRGKFYYFKNSIAGGEADHVIAYGHEDDEVLVGDWDGDTLDTLAVWRGKEYYFKNSIAGGEADLVVEYGRIL